MTDCGSRPTIEGPEHPGPSWFCSYFLVEMSRATDSPLVDDGLPCSAEKLAGIAHGFDRATYALPAHVGYSGEAARSVLHSLLERLEAEDGDTFAREVWERAIKIVSSETREPGGH